MSLTASQRIAAAHIRDQDRLILMGTRQVMKTFGGLQMQVLRAVRDGAGPKTVQSLIDAARPRVIPVVADAMTAAHMAGIVRAVASVNPAMPTALATTAFDPIVELLKRRASLSPSEIKAITDEFGAQAITATGDAFSLLEDKIQKSLRTIIDEGLHRDAGIGVIKGAFDAAGVTIDNPNLVRTIFTTEVSKAYNGGRWAASQDPDIQSVLWGYEYATVGDDRVRPNHASLDGTRLPKDDPRWATIWPPNGYNCRCSTIEIYTTDTRRATVKQPERGGVPDEGFAFNYGLALAS